MTTDEKMKDLLSRYYGWMIFGAFLIGAFIRFFQLGQSTLNDYEAQNALQALNIVRRNPVVIGGQPGYVGLTSMLFFLFGGSDFSARFWPALFGSLLVLVPLFFRKELGGLAIIVMAFLLALEPGLVAMSRTADGVMITIVSLAAAFGFYRRSKPILSGILFGLALSASGQFWYLFVALTISCLIFRLFIINSFTTVQLNKSEWLKMGVSALITVTMVSSIFMTNPAVISGLGAGIVEYFSSWRQIETMTLSTYMLVWILLQFPAVILGIWGLIVGIKEKSKIFSFLGFWWVVGLFLVVLNPSHSIWSLVLADLPLFILCSLQITRLIDGMKIQSKVVVTIETMITFSLIIFSTINFLNLVNFPPADDVLLRNRLLGTLLPLGLWIAFSALLAWGWDNPSTRSGLVIGLGVLLFGLLAGSGWKAAGLGSQPHNEFFVSGSYVSGKLDVKQTLSDIARWNNGEATRIDVDLAGISSPSLEWFLRDIEKVTKNLVFPVTYTPSVVISGMDSIVNSQALYRGKTIIWSVRPDLENLTWQDWVKWFFNRSIPENQNNILLWVRNDLFKDVVTQ